MTATFTLTQEQVEMYQRDGFVLLPAAFGADEVVRLRAAADRLLELLINSSLALGEVNPRLLLRTRGDGKQVVVKVQPLNDVSASLEAASADPRLLDPMRQLMGAEPVLMEEKLLYKQVLAEPVDIPAHPEDDSIALHHDWGAYRAQGYPTDTMSSAITLDELRPEKGTLCFFAGSQRVNFPLELNYTQLGSTRMTEVLPALGAASLQDAVPIIAPPGSILVFDSLVVHYSGSNQTDEPRRLLIYSHYPAWHESEPDKRNRPNRLRAQEHERRYRAQVASGAYADRWQAPPER